MSVCPLLDPQVLSHAHGEGIASPFPSRSRKYNVRVEDIMLRDIHYITLNCKYRDLQHVLQSTKMKSLPLVESAGEMWARLWLCQDGKGGMEKGVSGANAAHSRRQSP